MKKNIGLLLATIMVLNTVSSMAFAWENPLKKYNLYEDVTGGKNVDNPANERVMNEYNQNSLRSGSAPSSNLSYDQDFDVFQPKETAHQKTRNETLRESSRNVYSDPEITPGWEIGPSFYQNPSLDSIKEKYRRSDFAGCLQECISYVRLHPYDTFGFYYLAMCYTKVNDKDNAVLAYEKVIALNDSPMIVKYATNGRNCVMGNDSEICYPNVNEPEIIYPYADIAKTVDLTPVDPNTLVNRNLKQLKEKLSPVEAEESTDTSDPNNKDKQKLILPFGRQDEELDKFINAPYGNGLSPELNKEYKQLQLNKIKETVNKGEESHEKDFRDLNDIKKFDNQKSDSELVKLAYSAPVDSFENMTKEQEVSSYQSELDELNMLFGNSKSKNETDIMDLLPYMTEQGNHKNLSPEVIQALMMKSMMSDLTL